jgi:poly-gamma-glutamate capsule biosynthesis protein CapA/YwtB (metallophosphatase superfamily)
MELYRALRDIRSVFIVHSVHSHVYQSVLVYTRYTTETFGKHILYLVFLSKHYGKSANTQVHIISSRWINGVAKLCRVFR